MGSVRGFCLIHSRSHFGTSSSVSPKKKRPDVGSDGRPRNRNTASRPTREHSQSFFESVKRYVATYGPESGVRIQEYGAIYMAHCCEIIDPSALKEIALTIEDVADLAFTGKSRCTKKYTPPSENPLLAKFRKQPRVEGYY